MPNAYLTISEKVVLIADGSDEITAGYIYHHNAPSPEAVHEDAKRLLRELHLYDLLRAERCTAYHGLQSRLPFLDRKFIDYYMRFAEIKNCNLSTVQVL